MWGDESVAMERPVENVNGGVSHKFTGSDTCLI